MGRDAPASFCRSGCVPEGGCGAGKLGEQLLGCHLPVVRKAPERTESSLMRVGMIWDASNHMCHFCLKDTFTYLTYLFCSIILILKWRSAAYLHNETIGRSWSESRFQQKCYHYAHWPSQLHKALLSPTASALMWLARSTPKRDPAPTMRPVRAGKLL